MSKQTAGHYMTVKQLRQACERNTYILARFDDGILIGVNCRFAPLALKELNSKENNHTDCIGFIPCDFQTYITYKKPFTA